MSLINDALKKAQHQRTGGSSELPPMPGSTGASRNARRGQSMPAQTLAIIVGGGAAVAILAVGITLYVVNREPATPVRPAPRPVASAPAPAASEPVSAAPVAATPSPVVAAPVTTAPIVAAPVAAPSKAPVTAPVIAAAPAKIDLSSQKLPPAEAVVSAPVELKADPAATEPPLAPATVLPGGQDIRILTYIDAIRVAGIRASGSDSKVLMNDRVYRINDMVDYTLGLRLTKVATDGLTFTDSHGTVYVKNF